MGLASSSTGGIELCASAVQYLFIYRCYLRLAMVTKEGERLIHVVMLVLTAL